MIATASVSRRSFGRFRIVRLLGHGAQSDVYLAFDPRLEREVALKTVRLADSDLASVQLLLREARAVSQLSHPHIVPVFEADTAEGNPYLIFEYVRGQTLLQHLRSRQRLEPQQAVALILPVLEAVEHAHQHQVIHRDLKPSNILLNEKDQPKVMDFGVAVKRREEAGEAGLLMGTPAYMAPEYVNERRVTPQTDVFSAGLILYEMLVGHPAIAEQDVHQALYRIAHEEVRLPDDVPAGGDEGLRDIVHKALMRDCALRYPTMAAFRQALEDWLRPTQQGDAEASSTSKQSTLSFLLRRMKRKTDFPALSDAISRINKLASSEHENISTFASAILKDFALTNKILRMVNSAFYCAGGEGTVSTVSRAIHVLGVTAVRNLAISLILFEHLQNKVQATRLQEEFLRANLCGVLARDLRGKQARDGEEAFICAMLHGLGRKLALYYFPEEAEEVDRLASREDGLTQDRAALRVLGISYEELGSEIARSWGFPNTLVRSMKSIPADAPLRRPESREETLQLLAEFATEVCQSMGSAKEGSALALAKLTTRFGPVLGIDEKRLRSALEQSASEVHELGSILRMNLSRSPLGQQVRQLVRSKAVPDAESLQEHSLATAAAHTSQALRTPVAIPLAAARVAKAPAAGVEASAPVPDPDSTGDRLAASLPASAVAARADRQDILTTGIQDISNTLVENFQLNDIVRMVLETMYRAMEFQRVVFCLRDAATSILSGRMGFGKEADEIARKFSVPLNDPKDLFSVAAKKGVDVLIKDADAPNIAAPMPAWFKGCIDAKTFLLLPISLRNMPVALIYADQLRPGQIVVTEKELALLRTLRNQIVLAMKSARG